MIEWINWINFISLICAYVLFSIFYTLSTQPVKRKERRGELAWKDCARLRQIAAIFEFLIAINDVLWIWFPVSILSWRVNSNWWVGFGIFLIILIPGLILESFGVKEAGKESMTPSPDTKQYGGIYKYIRHPQSVGEFPMFVAFGFLANSWLLVVIAAIYVVIYFPIMVHFEEEDLIRRFGKPYEEYRKRTGAIFPRFSKK